MKYKNLDDLVDADPIALRDIAMQWWQQIEELQGALADVEEERNGFLEDAAEMQYERDRAEMKLARVASWMNGRTWLGTSGRIGRESLMEILESN